MSSVDLQRIAESALGRGKHAGKARLYRSPWRDDLHPSFAVYADGFKDFATGDHGDAVEFIRRHYGLQDRRQAAEFLTARGYDLPGAKPRHEAPERPEIDAPPSATWQALASGIAERAAAYLWSGRDDANAALAYLRGRGLTDDTIRTAGLGFNPRRMSVETTPDELTTLAAGVTIPIRVSGVTFALKVNAIDGAPKLAAALGRPIRQDAAKYVYLRGSQTGAPFIPQGDDLPDDLPVLIVEGEFDAMIAQQQLHGAAAVITLGSATNTPARRWRDMLRGRAVYIAGDNDPAGRAGAAALATVLQGSAIDLPSEVKDANDYHLTGGDLRAWFEAAIIPATDRRTASEPAPIAATATAAPLSWINALANLRGGGINAAMAVALAMTGIDMGILDPTGFTARELESIAGRIGWQLSNPLIIWRGLVLAVSLGIVFRFEGKERNLFIAKSEINSRGRRQDVYTLPSADDIRAAIMRAAYAEIDERAHPTTDDDPARAALAELTPAALQDADVTSQDATALSADLKRARASVRSKRDGGAWYRAREAREALAAALRDMTPLELDPAFTVTNAGSFRIALVRALAIQHDGAQLATFRREVAPAGVKSAATLKRVMSEARIGVKERSLDELTEARIIMPGQNARATIREHIAGMGAAAAYALRIVDPQTHASISVKAPDNQYKSAFPIAPGRAADTAEQYLSAGHGVIVEYRRSYTIDVRPADDPAPELTHASARTRSAPQETTRRDSPQRPETVECGHYRRSWVVGQIADLLTRMGWRQDLTERRIDEYGEIVPAVFRNPQTGHKCSAASRDVAELLTVFAGRDIQTAPRIAAGDPLLTFAGLMGATIKAISAEEAMHHG